jgi:hypothetical protein
MANTYDWIIDTADSNNKSIHWIKIKIVTIRVIIEGPVFPNKVISKCPAIMLAVNRTANVPGRIIFLIVSIQTMNGIRIEGVPWGTKWQNICWVLFNHP